MSSPLSMAEFDERTSFGALPPRGAPRRMREIAKLQARSGLRGLGQSAEEDRRPISVEEVVQTLQGYGYVPKEPAPSPDDATTTVPMGKLARDQEEGGADYAPDLPDTTYWTEPADEWQPAGESTAPEPDYVLTDAEYAQWLAEQEAVQPVAPVPPPAEELAPEPTPPAPEGEEMPPGAPLPPAKSMLPVIALLALALIVMGEE